MIRRGCQCRLRWRGEGWVWGWGGGQLLLPLPSPHFHSPIPNIPPLPSQSTQTNPHHMEESEHALLSAAGIKRLSFTPLHASFCSFAPLFLHKYVNVRHYCVIVTMFLCFYLINSHIFMGLLAIFVQSC